MEHCEQNMSEDRDIRQTDCIQGVNDLINFCQNCDKYLENRLN